MDWLVQIIESQHFFENYVIVFSIIFQCALMEDFSLHPPPPIVEDFVGTGLDE